MSWANEDICRCRVNSSIIGAGLSLNIFTAEVEEVLPTLISNEDMETVWADYLDNIFDSLLDHISLYFETTSFDLYKWSGVEWDWVSNAPYSPTFTGTSQILPAGVAAVITAYTAINRVVGRKFLAGIAEESVAGGLFSAGLVADLVLAATSYISSFTTYPELFLMHPGVYSTKMSAFVPFSLTALITNIPGYQRRRKTGVGD